jgi:hypothetical protein
MSSRNMSLLPRASLRSDSEQEESDENSKEMVNALPVLKSF